MQLRERARSLLEEEDEQEGEEGEELRRTSSSSSLFEADYTPPPPLPLESPPSASSSGYNDRSKGLDSSNSRRRHLRVDQKTSTHRSGSLLPIIAKIFETSTPPAPSPHASDPPLRGDLTSPSAAVGARRSGARPRWPREARRSSSGHSSDSLPSIEALYRGTDCALAAL